jgi:hypothetical protein
MKERPNHEEHASPAVQVWSSQEHSRTHVFQSETRKAAQYLQLSGVSMQELRARAAKRYEHLTAGSF